MRRAHGSGSSGCNGEVDAGLMGESAWALREIATGERQRFTAEGWWPDQSVGRRWPTGLAANRDLPFVIHSRTRPWQGTFGDVLDLARRAASGLVAAVCARGTWSPSRPRTGSRGRSPSTRQRSLGAVVAPIVHIYGSRETSYILDACRPRVHVTAARFGHQDFLANLETMPDIPGMQLRGR